MGFHKLLERMGFVRLSDYGLLMTADRRIVTTRKVIDDGFGAVVVGYANADLAGLELAPPPPIAPPARPVPPPVLVAPPPPAPVLFTITKPEPAPPALPPPAPAPVIQEEDDWEWEIAAARARAVEEPIVRTPAPVAPAPWLTKEPLTQPTWTEDTAIRSVTRLAKLSEQRFAPAGATPRTIIPVPTLPVANDPQEVTRQLPVARLARGTGRY